MKKVLLVIFETLFTENCPFSDNFDQSLFLVKLLKGFFKSCLEVNLRLNFDQFLQILCHDLTKNKLWSKLSENGQFSVNKV